MKCESVASLWSSSPPSHQISAAATLPDPPSLFTGASDGSIAWWKLPADDLTHPARAPRPFALLLGHAAPVSALAPLASGLFSACSDAVLCVWSAETGFCRRRRSLPPWAGSPAVASTLPGTPRYVCVACTNASPALGDVDRDKSRSRIAVLVVDSYGLNVVQTVVHGVMSLCRLRFAHVAAGLEGDAVILADERGNVEVVGIAKDGEVDDGETRVRRSISNCPGESSKLGLDFAVWMDVHRMILAIAFRTHCIFRSIAGGSVVGEIHLKDTPLLNGDPAAETQLEGCMFLQQEESSKVVAARFMMWSTDGAAVMYVITGTALDGSGGELFFKPICKIPDCSQQILGGQNLVVFCESQRSVLRIRSCCSFVGGLAIWKPSVTIYSIPDISTSYFDSCSGEGGMFTSTIVAEGCFPLTWNELGLSNAKQLDSMHCLDGLEQGAGSSVDSPASAKSAKSERSATGIHVVASSMVLSENSLAPYAIVNGFYDGDIEVTRFWNSSSVLGCLKGSVGKGTGSNIIRQSFIGHTGGVVCLAAHRMAAKPSDNNLTFVLLSGSLDCTVRIWDMNRGNVVAILHHHVGPVRQIILPPPSTLHPWDDCFLSVSEDCCVALISLETLKVERMFPGHPSYPSKVAWDGARGFVACFCRNVASHPDAAASLYIWDVKSGARDRVLLDTASCSMFDHFCRRIDVNELTGNVLGGTTSASQFHLPVVDHAIRSSSGPAHAEETDEHNEFGHNQTTASMHMTEANTFTHGNRHSRQSLVHTRNEIKMPAVRCSCPLPGIAVLKFDLASILSLQGYYTPTARWGKQVNTQKVEHGGRKLDQNPQNMSDTTSLSKESLEGELIRFSLAFLHLWDIDKNLDLQLMDGMNIFKPDGLLIASGILGDKGSLMLTFPDQEAVLELWKSSAEFSAMRSLTIVSLAQCLITLSHPSSIASSALAAFYTRNFAEKIPVLKPPLLQVLVSFWQDSSEHVRMAARSLFHCAAPRAVPSPIYSDKITRPGSPSIPVHIGQDYSQLDESCIVRDDCLNGDGIDLAAESDIIGWLESYEMQDWISCIGGTPRDAMASHIIVAAALTVWYPSIVKSILAKLVVHHLIKLVMVVNEHYSSTAAELLSEGMESTWKICIASEIPRLIGDLFFQIECLSGSSASSTKQTPALAISIQEALVGILLPSLAMSDIPGFLHVIERQIWATASDSPVHLVSLKTLIRVIRGSPKPLIPYLDKVVNFILQTMDPANPAIRKVCFQVSTAALKEVARSFPMIALDEPFLRLAVGDAFGDMKNAIIKVYDLQSLSKVKVLDASGPLGLPIFSGATDASVTTAISVVSFSPDGEGLVAFSEQGLVIRWWSLGSAWWEKLSRNTVPTQCTKLIFVPPWEGFSPNSSRSSIIASMISHGNQTNLQEKRKDSSDDSMKVLLHNLDLSYRLEWIDGRKVMLTRFGRELGAFQF